MAYFFTRRLDEAAEMLSLSIREVNFPGAYRSLASCYAHMGRLNEAREVIERLRATTSEVIPSRLPYSNPEQRDFYLVGLRLAVGEER
jgi:adenylate cyclase